MRDDARGVVGGSAPQRMNMEVNKLDIIAVNWLVDCLIADGKEQKVSRFSDFLTGKHPKDLTITELLDISKVASVVSRAACGE